jgi:hypothetical protein
MNTALAITIVVVGGLALSVIFALIYDKFIMGPSPTEIDWCRGGHDF